METKAYLHKTVTIAFHLNNREAKHELAVCNHNKLLPFCTVPTYRGVKLGRSLSFRHHIQTLRQQLKSRIALLRRLAGSRKGADAKTLRIAVLYAWCNQHLSIAHQSSVVVLKLTSLTVFLTTLLRIVTECLLTTPTDYLPILASIQLTDLCRKVQFFLVYCSPMGLKHLLHQLMVEPITADEESI